MATSFTGPYTKHTTLTERKPIEIRCWLLNLMSVFQTQVECSQCMTHKKLVFKWLRDESVHEFRFSIPYQTCAMVYSCPSAKSTMHIRMVSKYATEDIGHYSTEKCDNCINIFNFRSFKNRIHIY